MEGRTRSWCWPPLLWLLAASPLTACQGNSAEPLVFLDGGPATDLDDGGPATDLDDGGPATDLDDGGPASDLEDGGPASDLDDGGPATDAGPVPPLFDLPAIRDPATASCELTQQRVAFADGAILTAWNVSFRSWESIGGELRPIRIRGFLARPADAAGGLPGIVVAHGLGGYAEEDDATAVAARTGAMVLAYTGPGGGSVPDNTSEGLPAMDRDGYRLFETLPDPRGSWFWGHTVAALRALTCLQAHPEVDPARLGMTGFSAGGVATLLAAAVDDRIRAAVPVSASLAWDVAVSSPDAWQVPLLQHAGLTTASPEWLRLLDSLIAADSLLPGTRAAVLMVNGTTDEFFPIPAHVATFAAIPGATKRTSFVGNFDHGCFSLSGVESEEVIDERAELRRNGGQRFWFRHHLAADPAFPRVPVPPLVTLQPAGGGLLATALVDMGDAALAVTAVRLWMSNDNGFIWFHQSLDEQGSGLYAAVVAAALVPESLYYVDVEYRSSDLLFPTRFSISTLPTVPDGFVPHLREQETCL